jgi:hypothetical protein
VVMPLGEETEGTTDDEGENEDAEIDRTVQKRYRLCLSMSGMTFVYS